MILTIALLIGGLLLLAFGGDVLVRGASGIALRFGVRPVVVGVVIVGFGTSMPELVTSIEAVIAGSPQIAWGNIAGSNIANSLLILGAAAAITPLVAHGSARVRDPLVALGVSLVMLGIGWWALGGVSLGIAMLAALLIYVWRCYRDEVGHERDAEWHENDDPDALAQPQTMWRPILRLVIGLALLVAGGQMLVGGAIDIARIFGVPETIIGLSVVALGTSLPELATSVVAALRGNAGVALGNVIGSNIYNILLIGGATMILAPGAPPAQLAIVEWPLVALTALVILGLCAWRGRVGRPMGIALLAAYGAYIGFLALQL